MKEFINKLIGKFLGECVIYAENYEKALNIANELTEEYINISTDTSSGYCEWHPIDEEKSVYKSGCKKQSLYDGNPTESMYEFCPYCGKKIKVEGVTENELS